MVNGPSPPESESVSLSVVSDSLRPHGSHKSPVHEILGLPFPSPGHLTYPGIEPGSVALQADSLPSEPPGKPLPLLGISLICRSLPHSWLEPEIPCLFSAHR